MHMTKRWLALLLAVLMVLAMTACGSDKNPVIEAAKSQQSGQEETLTEEPEAEAPAEEAPAEEDAAEEALEPKIDTGDFVRGTVDGNTYESTAMGIGCMLEDGWTTASLEELAQLTGVDPTSLTEEEMIQQMLEADAIYDFYAMSGEGTALLQVLYEDLGALYGTLLNEEGYVDVLMESVEEQMNAAGMTDVQAEKTTTVFAGEERTAIMMTSQMPVEGLDQPIAIYQKLVPIKTGNYMGVVWAVTYMENTTDTVLDSFYALS